MAKPWSDVSSSQQFQALPPEQQEAARQQYFSDVVAPQVPSDQIETVKSHFDADTGMKAAPKGDSFMDRLNADFAKRVGEGQDAANAYVSGQQSLPLTYFDMATKVGVGRGSDAIGEVINSAASYAPQSVKDAVGNVVSSISNSPVGDAARFVGHQYQDIAQRYPNAARHVEGAALLGGMLAPEIPVKGTSIANTAVEAANPSAKFLKQVGQDLIAAPENLPVKAASSEVGTLGAQAKSAAKSDYDLFEQVGGGLQKDQVADFSNRVNALRPTDPAKAAIWDRGGVKEAIDTINNATSGGELSFSGAQALRADVNSQLKTAYRAGEDTKASHLMQVKNLLTDVLTNPENASHLDIKAKNAWQSANHEFAKGSLLEDLELLAAKASGKAQPANSLDTAINGFLNDKKKSGALRPEERDALMDVVKKTQTGELLKSGASRLIPAIGGAVGGPAGFLVGHYGSQLSRTTAEALKLKKLDKVYELINSRVAPEALESKPPLLLGYDRRGTLERGISDRKAYEQSKSSSGPAINLGEDKQLALPSPNEISVTKSGSAKKMTIEDLTAAFEKRKDLTELGMTPDIQAASATDAARKDVGPVGYMIARAQEGDSQMADALAKALKMKPAAAREYLNSLKGKK